ncbi:MAG: arabinose transporter [Geminicoccaceae bacterium]
MLPADRGPMAALLAIMAVVLVAFLVIGLALPVLPLHVHQTLGFDAFVVGLVAGSQFAASLLSRVWAGHYADRRGGKRTVLIGLVAAAAAGVLYLLSLLLLTAPLLSVTVLLLGRGLLGAAESLIITGALSWGLGRVGRQSAGRVIAWVGMAMFAALALGAPIGTTLYGQWGFAAIALATALLPLAAMLPVAAAPAVPGGSGGRPSLWRVAGAIWLPGLGAALGSVGFGAILTFSSLLFSGRGWSPIWLPFSTFAAFLILARIVGGHWPDRLGGARVALVSALVEAVGLAVIWLAPDRLTAAAGAALAGFGYSLVYPGLGLEAIRRAPAQSRGLAMGAFTACLDLALGVAGPALGLLASGLGLGSVFLAGALIVAAAAGISLRLLRTTA